MLFGWVRYGGVVVALFGFVITRLFVAEALRFDSGLAFLVAGIVPLVVGLGVSVYGVAIAIGAFSRAYANTVARWCVMGTGGMVLIVAVTAAGTALREESIWTLFVLDSRLLVANVLLGGAVGGLLIGDRTAVNNDQRRELERRANRARLVNRLLRHEVINAVTVVQGYTEQFEADEDQAETAAAIRTAAERIHSTVEEIGAIAEERDELEQIDVTARTEREVERLRSRRPEATVRLRTTEATAPADERFGRVVRELLTNAVENGTAPVVAVAVDATGPTVDVSVADDGPGLPAEQRALLEAGEFPEYDDPTAGFGLQIVRLLVVRYGGEVTVSDEGPDGPGTTVTVTLPWSEPEETIATAVSVTFPNLCRSVIAGAVAGIAMGVFFQLQTGLLPVIGALYGVANPVVGWVTHLFHSVVFALLFAAICSRSVVQRYRTGVFRAGVLGVLWGVTLWLLAAGVLMPVWLSLVGFPTTLPNLSGLGLVGHGLWGVVLGVGYWSLQGIDLPSVSGG
jgi:signal transduction histidine kinase